MARPDFPRPQRQVVEPTLVFRVAITEGSDFHGPSLLRIPCPNQKGREPRASPAASAFCPFSGPMASYPAKLAGNHSAQFLLGKINPGPTSPALRPVYHPFDSRSLHRSAGYKDALVRGEDNRLPTLWTPDQDFSLFSHFPFLLVVRSASRSRTYLRESSSVSLKSSSLRGTPLISKE